jgi:carbon storage regulator
MLVLARKENESVMIGNGIQVKVLEIRSGWVRLGFVAPGDTRIARQELLPTDKPQPEETGKDFKW